MTETTQVRDIDGPATSSADAALVGRVVLEIKEIEQTFHVRSGRRTAAIRAVDGVTLTVAAGETLGLVGESGCGKSSLAKAVVQEPAPSKGQVLVNGRDLVGLSRREIRARQASIQLVFQDPHSSLNPRWTVREIVAEPLNVQRRGTRAERRRQVDELLTQVDLDPARFGGRRPRQLSGGQAQRVAIARALALDPDVLVCDEVVSALDVSIQAQILNLFLRLKSERQLACLFIAHDLAVVKHVSDRIAVMYLGRVVELAPADELHRRPAHPYTDGLISAIPVPDPSLVHLRGRGRLVGEPPSPKDPPDGCAFRARCPRAQAICAVEAPALRPVARGHESACHFPLFDETVPVPGPVPGPTSARRDPD